MHLSCLKKITTYFNNKKGWRKYFHVFWMPCDITENFVGPSLNIELLQCQPLLQYLIVFSVRIETVFGYSGLFILRLADIL